MNVKLIFLLISVCTLSARSQSPFNGFIGSSKKDPIVSTFDRQVQYLDTKPYRLSPLQKLELRTESNQLDPERQDYALRLNPANPWELRRNNDYFKELRSALMLEKSIVLKEVLVARYTLIIELVTSEGLRELAERKLKLTQTYLSMLEKQQLSGYFDGEDYVELKLEEMDKSVELDEATYEAENTARKVVGLYPEAKETIASWSLNDVIDLAQIEKIIDSLEAAPVERTSLTYYQKKIDLANSEYSLEKTNVNVGYFQAQYQQFRIDQGRKPWSLGLGVTIPLFNPNKGDMTKRKLEAIESQQELEETTVELKGDKERSREQLKKLVVSYKTIQEKINTLNVSSLARTLNTLQNSNPVAGVRFQSNLIKLEELSLKLKQSILLTYVEWLSSADVLQQTPLVNYLSKSLETIYD